MVFESVLAEVLNTYIGDYVENLDRSQLKVGIWGGDVVLQDLTLKQSALGELNLPVKTVFGHLGKLVLKIPWKNLYGAPVVASVEHLFLLVVPDVEGQDHFRKSVKQAELQRLEIIKKFKKEADKANSSDTFVEKLATQIIKNVQVKIRDIHIRYEDELANPECPFSVGITLHNLSMETADKNWKGGVVQDITAMIYKVLNLEELAVYWNCHMPMFTKTNGREHLLKLFQGGICTKECPPEGFSYVLGPINSSARLQINPSPEKEGFKIPKILLMMIMEQLAVGINKEQYRSFIDLLEFFNQMSWVSAFRVHRPHGPRCKGHYKKWWKFATTCTLKQIGYKSHGVNWNQVFKHRSLCRTYASAYRTKLQQNTVTPEVQKVIEDCEEDLDVFNIMLVRQQIEAEMDWLDQQNKAVKAQTKTSWFSGFFGRGTSNEKENNLTDKFKKEMSAEERLKLYQAIDYKENTTPAQYPIEFVSTQIHFQLNRLSVDMHDDMQISSRILLGELRDVSSNVQWRPTANAVKVAMKMGQFTVFGAQQNSVIPKIISSRIVEDVKPVLVNMIYESNPLDGKCDQRLRLHALPLQIVYDAYTINRVVIMFRVPQSAVLAQIQTIAGSKLSTLKQKSTVGLQRAIQQHTITDIEVDLKSSLVLIPYGGSYLRKEEMLVANLGYLRVLTLPWDQSTKEVLDVSGDCSMETIRDKSYDRYVVELQDMQVMMALSGEDWETTLALRQSSPMHVLEPTALTIHVEKCLVRHDPTLPNVRIVGKLPSITVHVEENRLIRLISLYHSISFPSSVDNIQIVQEEAREKTAEELIDHFVVDTNEEKEVSFQTTKLDLKFEMGVLKVLVYKPHTYMWGQLSKTTELQKIAEFSILGLEVTMSVRMHDVVVTTCLGGILLKYNGPEGALTLLDPAKSLRYPQEMLTIKYTSVDPDSPEFHTKYNSVQQKVVADFTRISILLHQEAVVALLDFFTSVNEHLRINSEVATTTEQSTLQPKINKSVWQHGRSDKVIQFEVKACLHELCVCLIQKQQLLSELLIEGMEALTSMRSSSTHVIAKLRNVTVLGSNPESPYHKILSIVGSEALSLEVFINNNRRTRKKADMAIKAQMACSKIVYLNAFFTTVMDFLSTFHAAQEVVVEAAQAAKQKVLNAHAKAKFIQLDIALQAPLVIVPVNSTSLDTLHMNFGRLTIKNKFVEPSDDTHQSPALDMIQMYLQDLHLSRVSSSTQREYTLIPSVSFVLHVKRNLSISWCKDIPDIDIQGWLDNVEMVLGIDDVHMMMKILSENLAQDNRTTVKTVVQSYKPSDTDSLKVEVVSSAGRSLRWDLRLNMKTLKLVLGMGQKMVALFTMTSFDVVIKKEVNMHVGFRIKDITIMDLDPKTIHKEVVKIEGDEVLSAELIIYDQNTTLEDNDMVLKAKMACIKIVFLGRFFSTLMAFLNAFQEVHGDFAEAVAGAAEAAKQGVLKAQTKSKRISLNVNMKAPVIILPIHSKSYDALFMDFGNLTIRNKFVTIEDPGTSRLAIIDDIQLGLQNLKVSRVLLSEQGDVVAEWLLLQPVNFLLQVKRNLCASWYKVQPDIEVQGNLRSLVMAVNQEDIQKMLTVLSQNLGDIAPASQKDISSSVSSSSTSFKQVKKTDSVTSVRSSIPVRFTFTMDSLVVELFDELSCPSKPKLLPSLSMPVHVAENSLARFTLHMFGLKGLLCSDGSITTTLLLVDCRLDDTRMGNKSKLTRLMERKSDATSSGPVPRNVEIVYKKKEFHTDVDIQIFSFNLVLNVKYLKKVGDFFSAALQNKTNINSSTTRVKSHQIMASSTLTQDSTMTVNLHAEKPDIFLVEDMENLDTSALVLRSEINCVMKQGINRTEIKGSIQELQLYSCCYNSHRRNDTMSQILLPCSLEIEGCSTQLDVGISNVRLRVSPGAIELLSKVMRAVYSREDSSDVTKDKNPDLSNLWEEKPLQENDFWFLRRDVASEATEYMEMSKHMFGESEICIVHAPSIAVTVEAGIGSRTLPMVLFNASLNATIHDWSSQLCVNSSLTLQMAYYNSALALWEPLIEPAERLQNGRLVHSPWELSVKVEMDKSHEHSSAAVGDFASPSNDQRSMNIHICSKDNLELTVTKTCVDVLTNLSKAFRSTMDEVLQATKGPASQYVVHNHIGLPITLMLSEGPFEVYFQTDERDCPILRTGESIGLNVDDSNSPSPVSLLTRGQADEKFLKIVVHQLECVLNLPVVQANKRYFPLHGTCGLVSDVRIDSGSTIVTLRSIVQIFNHLSVPIDVHCKLNAGARAEYVGTVSPAEHMDLPIHAIYTPSNELFFCVPGFSMISYAWTETMNAVNAARLYECVPLQSSNKTSYYLRIVGTMEQAYFENSSTKLTACVSYKLHVRPAIVLKNLLPCEMECSQSGIAVSNMLRAGERLQLGSAKPGQAVLLLKIPNYRQNEWKYLHKIQPNCQEFSVARFVNNQNQTIDLGIHTIQKNGSMIISLYCPFWFLNKTGLQLSYWQSDESSEILYHPSDNKNPVLFSSFSAKKKAAIKVGKGLWSDRFSIDVAGSSGVISCTMQGYIYKIGVHIHLMRATLIKQVTFTPYYVLINNTTNTIECQETDRSAGSWYKVDAGSCCALWPCQPDSTVKLRARVSGTSEVTPPFTCSTVHTTLLQLNNKYGGLNVDIQLTEGAVHITFTSYEPGQAPALIINHTEMMIAVSEKGTDKMRTLTDKEMSLFTWSDPCGLRQLVWCPKVVDGDVCRLCKDGSGIFYPTPDIPVYWRSFLDGLQRVLLFSWDKSITQSLQDSGRVLQNITVTMHGVGLSIVNNLSQTELLYIGISRKPTRPNMKSKSKRTSTGENSNSKVGLWMHAKVLPHEMQIHAKVHHLQADNQLLECKYPVALAPVPLPRTVAANTNLRPFAEMRIVRRSMKHSSLQQFKYLKVLVQEFNVKVDMGLVKALYTMLEAGQVSDDVEVIQFMKDRSLVGAPLLAHVALHSAQGQKNFFDLLHFSPLMIHLSFSLHESSRGKGQETPHALRVLLRSLGVTLTDVQDVVFKLSYFERQNTFLTQQQVISEAIHHYRSQALKQLYVLVLGLDVLGNPFGLVRSITRGVEDFFYEPFQGAIQGPEEFAEGLVVGVRSLLGHTVGGAAGAMSRITGAMGTGVAALTLDKEYQRKRQETLNQRPANVQTGLAQSSKGLVMGVVDGVSGVFTKPISGAKKDGVEGFFKGMGKGVLGLVARPTTGIIDFASGSLDAVKRTADTTQEVERQRPPRSFHSDEQIRPYSHAEAEGKKILQDLDDSEIATNDCYEFHLSLVPEKSMLMLTNKRIMYLFWVDIFGKWKMDWEHTWDTIIEQPFIQPNGIIFLARNNRKGNQGCSREIPIEDIEDRQMVIDKMNVLMKH